MYMYDLHLCDVPMGESGKFDNLSLQKNKLKSVFHVSVQLLTVNFIITLSK